MSLFQTSGGNVGIGTTNPSGTLDVRGTSMYVGNQVNSAAASGATSNANIVLYGAGNNPITGSLPSIYHRAYVGLGLCADYAISFEVNANTSRADAMRITATGLVGIGTTSPQNTLHVSGGRTRLVAGGETYALGVSYSEASGGMYWIGATNSGAPDLVFSQGGGSERMRITNAGIVQIPNQPAFRAYYGTGASTDFTTTTILPYNATQVNIGSCYSTSTYKFTAPVAGRYAFGASTYVAGVPSMWDITTANLGIIARCEWRVTSASQTVNSIISTTTTVELSAADTVWVVWASDTVRLIGASRFNSFWGYLIG